MGMLQRRMHLPSFCQGDHLLLQDTLPTFQTKRSLPSWACTKGPNELDESWSGNSISQWAAHGRSQPATASLQKWIFPCVISLRLTCSPRSTDGRARRFLAFMEGPRSCAGQALAVMNLTAALAILYGNFTFRLAEEVRHLVIDLTAALAMLCGYFTYRLAEEVGNLVTMSVQHLQRVLAWNGEVHVSCCAVICSARPAHLQQRFKLLAWHAADGRPRGSASGRASIHHDVLRQGHEDACDPPCLRQHWRN